MLVLKTGFRMFYKRKLETIAIVLLLFFASTLYIALYIDKDNFVYYIERVMVETLGHVSVFGYFDSDALELVKSIDGVEDAYGYYYWSGVVYIERNTSVGPARVKERVILYDSSTLLNHSHVHIVLREGRGIEDEYEAIIYTPAYSGYGSRGLPREFSIGSNITIYTYDVTRNYRVLNVTIVGRAVGIATYGEPSEFILLVSSKLIRNITNNHYTWIAVYSRVATDEYIEELSDKVVDALKEKGYFISGSWVNKPGGNPIEATINSFMSFFTTPLLLAIALVAVVSIAAGTSLVERNTRIIGVLKAIGVSNTGVFIAYSIPWILRGLAGVLIAAILSPYIARGLLAMFMAGESELIDYFIRAYGFIIEPNTLLTCCIVAFSIILLGSIVPGLVASRIKTCEALYFTGLKPRRTLGFRGGYRFRIAFRSLVSKPWKLATLVFTITIIWSLLVGIALNLNSMYVEYVSFVEENSDLRLYAYTVSYAIAEPVYKLYDEIRGMDGVRDVMLIDQVNIVNAIGFNEWFLIRTIVRGDPYRFWSLVDGRFPEKKGEIVLSTTVARLLGKWTGDNVTIRDSYGVEHSFKITGVIRHYINNGLTAIVYIDDFAELARMDREDVGAYNGVFYINLERGVDVEDFGWRLRFYVESKPSYRAWFMTREDSRVSILNGLSTIAGMLYGIAMLAYIVGIAGIASIFVIDFTGSLREIGVLRAIGFTNGDLVGVSFIEMILATILSIPIVAVLGYLTGEYMNLETVLAKGYIELKLSLSSLFGFGNLLMLLIAYSLSILVIYIYLRRQKTAEILRIE